MISSVPVCQNSTAYPFQTYCCCYGDGCNGVPGLFSTRQMAMAALGSLLSVLVVHRMT